MDLLQPKTYTTQRTFQLSSELSAQADRLVQKVLENLKKKTLHVYHPDGRGITAFGHPGKDGEIDLFAGATFPINIMKWLPMVCQSIRWGIDKPDDAELAHFEAHLDPLLPLNNEQRVEPEGYPLGPIAYWGEIVFNDNKFPSLSTDAFCMVIAHELVHVFRAMMIVVPAFRDWQTFRTTTQYREDLWRGLYAHLQRFVDRYGSQLELAELQAFWPVTLA